MDRLIELCEIIDREWQASNTESEPTPALYEALMALHELLLYGEAKATAPFPTDVASLRTFLQAGFDRLLGLPRFVLGVQDRAVIYGEQAAVADTDDCTVAFLTKVLAKTPERSERDDTATESVH